MKRINLAGLSIDVLDVGSGPPLLYLGPEHFGDANLPFIERLAEHRRVVAPRYPGFDGRTPPTDFRSVDDLAYMVLDLMDTLALTDTLVVGSSLGGWVALEMAVRSVARMRGLVLFAPLGVKGGDRTSRDFADFNALSAKDARAALFADLKAVPEFPDMDDGQMEQVGLDRQYLAHYAWNPYFHNPRLPRWLHRVTVPTRLVWGEADGYCLPSNAPRLLDGIPDASMTRLPNVGHYPQIEAIEESIVAIVALEAQIEGEAT